MKIIVYKVWSCSLLFLLLIFDCVVSCVSQEKNYETIVNSIVDKVERLTGYKYYISGTDIDESITDPTEKIKDPYHTLKDCFLFLAEGQMNTDINLQKGFIGLYKIKTDSIVWHSVLLTDNFSSGAGGRIVETAELNGDGKVEIIIAQAKEPFGTEQLWIFSWDGIKGNLITQIDSYGESTIIEFGEYYDLKDVDGDGIYEILGKWYRDPNSTTKTLVTYSWNGSLYGKWGKTSKQLLKNVKK